MTTQTDNTTEGAMLFSRRFLPLWLTQILGAFNDNLFKNALVILILFQLGSGEDDSHLLVAAAMGVFVSPWLLFSGIAGTLADRFEKAGMTRWLKVSELAVMGLGTVGFLSGNIPVLMVALFLMGTQSALFSPVKYALVPELLRRDELIAGNAWLEGGVYLAILGGTILGAMLIVMPEGPSWVAITTLALAAIGLAASLLIPLGEAKDPTLKVNANILASTWAITRQAMSDRVVRKALIVIGWFNFIGALFLTLLPVYVKMTLGGNPEVVTILLTVFSLGIAVGAVLCKAILGSEITARLAPLALIGVGIATFDLVLATNALPPVTNADLMGAAQFLQSPAHWRIMADLLVLTASGGVLIVPLYSLIQSHVDEQERARVIAASNVLNALFVILAAGFSALLLFVNWTTADIFLAAAILNIGMIFFAAAAWPQTIVRGAFKLVFKLAFRVRVKGLENLRKAPDNAVLVANHVSFLDGVLLATFLPGSQLFAVNTGVAKKWWAKLFLSVIRRAEIEPGNPHALKTLIRAAKSGERVVIFPEGRLTTTGSLMKVYDGAAVVADSAAVPVVPIRIAGAERSTFSKLGGVIPRVWFPQISITVLPAERLDCPADLKGAARRKALGQSLYDVMSAMMVASEPAPKSLPEELRNAAKIYGMDSEIVEDATGAKMTYRRLITASVALGVALARHTERGQHVGLLLPTSAAALTTFFALTEKGRIPAMLNFSAGIGPIGQACTTAQVSTIVTSRGFVEKANLGDLIDGLAQTYTLIYLEDLKSEISVIDKIWAALSVKLGTKPESGTSEDPAVILFTSGSEGAPKGVVLSHAALMTNCRQVAGRVAFSPKDKVFNPLPMFHAFGLTGGALLPVLRGTPTFLYPSPLHHKVIPELVYDTGATVLFGTDTFLAGYGKVADSYDFQSLRLIFAGAERVKPTTRALYAEKFGLRILEGYGATECGPVIAVNTPMHAKAGTVGRLLPGIEAIQETVEGYENGKRLMVSGGNVMTGYLRIEGPGVIQAPEGGWHDTGDIVQIDDAGFITLVDRAKRFAKIAGEMVPLGSVEEAAATAWPDAEHAAITLPCPRKGESVILVTTAEDAELETLRKANRAAGRSELATPSKLVHVEELPSLASGKLDYRAITAIAKSHLQVALPEQRRVA